MDHKTFKNRLPSTLSGRIKRITYYQFNLIENDFRQLNISLGSYLWLHIVHRHRMSLKSSVMRMFLAPMAWIKFKLSASSYLLEVKKFSQEETVNYENRRRGTYAELMKKLGLPICWNGLSPQAKTFFDIPSDSSG